MQLASPAAFNDFANAFFSNPDILATAERVADTMLANGNTNNAAEMMASLFTGSFSNANNAIDVSSTTTTPVHVDAAASGASSASGSSQTPGAGSPSVDRSSTSKGKQRADD